MGHFSLPVTTSPFLVVDIICCRRLGPTTELPCPVPPSILLGPEEDFRSLFAHGCSAGHYTYWHERMPGNPLIENTLEITTVQQIEVLWRHLLLQWRTGGRERFYSSLFLRCSLALAHSHRSILSLPLPPSLFRGNKVKSNESCSTRDRHVFIPV